MKLCVRLVDPSLDPAARMWGDAREGWVSAAEDWLGTLVAAGVPVAAGPDASYDDGAGLLLLPDPDAVDVPAQPGRPVLTGPPPPGAAARLAAVRQALGALAVPDLRGVLLLRLDDPGAAVKCHLDWWRHDDVTPEAWEALWNAVGPDGAVSLFCCTGFVRDDGTVVDSRTERPQEWAQLDIGVRRGAASLECHGHTHMDPDTAAWAGAPDRYSADHWFRELWPPRMATEPDVEVQERVLRRWQAAAGPGTSLVAPGECWGTATVTAARRRGFALMNSWGLCRLQLPVPTWTRGVGSPYLDKAHPAHLDEGLPAVGYWHDRDMALHGPAWAPQQLAAWRDCGATRLWSFDRLAGAYRTEIDAALVDGEVVVRSAPDVPLRIELKV
ncbi:MAG TPA: hypothetical protein VNB94_01215 [Mycobacteriales bacterium]|nr:hypothetical protein [Mycobacteriales bacterium]